MAFKVWIRKVLWPFCQVIKYFHIVWNLLFSCHPYISFFKKHLFLKICRETPCGASFNQHCILRVLKTDIRHVKGRRTWFLTDINFLLTISSNRRRVEVLPQSQNVAEIKTCRSAGRLLQAPPTPRTESKFPLCYWGLKNIFLKAFKVCLRESLEKKNSLHNSLQNI